MQLNKKKLSIGFTAVLLIVTIVTLIPYKDTVKVSHMSDETMGTIVYNVKVSGSKQVDYKPSIDSLLEAFNRSLSIYIPDSEISIFNESDRLQSPSNLFLNVFNKSKDVYERTNGGFDPTVGPLVNIWGFGPNANSIAPDSSAIDSALLLVSLEKVEYGEDVLTKDDNVQMDFGAIAKGLAIDELAKWLDAHGETNYLIEIGGEVRCSGFNEKGEIWSIGIQDPTVGDFEKKIAIAKLKDKSLATSGNYRNYYTKNEKIYAHIIDPRTGYSNAHNLLSASVVSADCMTADAFATAFMVLGLEESIELVESNDDLEAVFVFSSDQEMDVYVSTGITDIIELIEE